VLRLFFNNYFNYLSSTFLFVQGAGEWGYGMVSGRGVLYYIDALFLLGGLIALLTVKKYRFLNIILVWILIAPLPAAMTKGSGFAGTRTAVMMPAIEILSAAGAFFIYEYIRTNIKSNIVKVAYSTFLIVILSVSFISFTEDYLFHAPHKAASSMQYGRKNLITYIKDIGNEYQTIMISRSLSVPNIWPQFYLPIDPKSVQSASRGWLRYEKEGLVSIDQLDSYQVGKYKFGSIFTDELKGTEGLLIIAKPEEFPSGVKKLTTINDINNNPLFYVVDSRDL
jgi:hypothetical protein